MLHDVIKITRLKERILHVHQFAFSRMVKWSARLFSSIGWHTPQSFFALSLFIYKSVKILFYCCIFFYKLFKGKWIVKHTVTLGLIILYRLYLEIRVTGNFVNKKNKGCHRLSNKIIIYLYLLSFKIRPGGWRIDSGSGIGTRSS